MDENVPLVPKSTQEENHDAATIITDIFQDILEKPTFPKNVATNLSKFKIELPQLRHTGTNAKIEMENALMSMEDIAVVEESFMKVKAKYQIKEDKLVNSEKLQEFRLLKRIPLYKNIRKANVVKYGLIEKGDIYPTNMERIMDFNLNWNIHTCRPCVSDLDLVPVKLEKLPEITRKKDKKPKISKQVEIVFRPSKDTVTFLNYKMNVTYKKSFKIQNISKTTRSFYIDPLFPKNPCFNVFLVGESMKIPPGMCATICVTFKTDIFKNQEDFVKICERSGTEVIVNVKSYRDMPNLCIMVFKVIYPIKCLKCNLDMNRSIALNNCIDFGACFKGEFIQLYLFVRNCGGDGKFFILDEENWFSQNINAIDRDLKLYKGSFTIQPIYWKLDANEITFLFLTFCAKKVGLNLECTYLLCNNLSYEQVDVIADCILFDKHVITIKSPEFIPFESLINILYVFNGYLLSSPSRISDKHSTMFIGCSKMKQIAEELDSEEIEFSDICENSILNLSEPEISIEEGSEIQLPLSKDLPRTETDIIIDYLKEMEDTDLQEDLLEGINLERHILDYDICYPFETKTKKINIYNNCPVSLKYRWSYVKKTPELSSFKKLKTFHQNCINIVPTDCNLSPYSSKEVSISLTPDAFETGFYRSHLSLYVESVPKLALDNPEKFIWEVSSSNKNCVDVLIAEIEIICKIKEYNVVFKPSEINIHRLAYGTEYQKEFEIIIYHSGESSVNCYWNCKNPDVVSIDPHVYTANVNERIINNLIIRNKGFENISETLELVVHEHYKKELKIFALVQRSFLRILEDVLDFGWLQIGYTYSKKFSIINDNETCIDWELWEATDDENRAKQNEISLNVTDLDNGDIEAEYIVTAKEATEWHSFLNLYTKHSDETVLDSICRVTFGIDDLVVYMHTSMCECPILCPKDPIFLNSKSVFTVCLHNVSKINSYYHFEECYGEKSDLVQIKFVPNSGYLEAEKNVRVNVEILAFQCCVLDSLYVPCFISMKHPLMKGEYVVKDPIILTIVCVVDDISVNFQIPFVDDKSITVPWPPPKAVHTYFGSSQDENSSSEMLNSVVSLENSKEDICIDDITEYLKKIEEDTMQESQDFEPEIDSLRKFFDQDYLIHEYVIEFFNVPLRKATMKRIIVENITPIHGLIQANVSEFPPNIDGDEEVNNILIKINAKKDDEWERMLNENGICVKLDIAKNELDPYGSTVIDIWIYASTWGVYAEEVSIAINTLPTFYITVFAEIVGIPIEFPAAKNCRTKYPTYRFGIISHISKEISRKVYIKNISSIPIATTWQVIIESKDCDDNLIKMLFNAFKPKTSSLIRTPMKSEFYLLSKRSFLELDDSECRIFQIIPDEVLINPGQTALISIIFNPTIYSANLHDMDLGALLVGTMNPTKTYISRPNIYRNFGIEMGNAKMVLTATLILPSLNIEVQEENKRYVLYASEVIHQNSISETRTLFLRNPSVSNMVLCVVAEEPFRVLELRTENEVVTEEGKSICLGPGQCLKVKIRYVIKKEILREICNILYDKKSLTDFSWLQNEVIDFEKLCYQVKKDVEIMQNLYSKQKIPLEIVIYFPNIEVPAEIDFGIVFIGNNKKQILTIRNYSACKVEISVTGTEDFIVNPTTAVLLPTNYQEPSFLDISVIFIPSMVNLFEANVGITLTALDCKLDVYVTGIGTNDEKHSFINTA